MNLIQKNEGRYLFGANIENYVNYRPPYPEQVFELLREEWNYYPGTNTLEIGAGTGAATARLMKLGAKPLVAVEPDSRFNPFLQQIERDLDSSMTIVNQSFEDVEFTPASFDLVVSATAFHWVDQKIGLRKIVNLLKKDGMCALWWNIFGDPNRPNPFHKATEGILKNLSASPSHQNRIHFALEKDQRIADILDTGRLTQPHIVEFRWLHKMNATQLRGLYVTFSSIQMLEKNERQRILDELVEIAQGEFGGFVEIPMVTVMYLTRKSGIHK